MKRLLSLVSFAILAATPECKAVATNTSISFSGACTDCTGSGNGTLVVSSFTPGNALNLSLANFVSFSYNGTNLLSPFVITSPSSVSGTLGPTFPGAYNVTIVSGVLTFQTSTSGSWSISTDSGVQDFGAVSSYNLAASVPEPATFFAIGLGLAGLLIAARRARV